MTRHPWRHSLHACGAIVPESRSCRRDRRGRVAGAERFSPGHHDDERVPRKGVHPRRSRKRRCISPDGPLTPKKTGSCVADQVCARVRFDGDWEYWVRFFMRGVLEVSNQAVDTAKALIALVEGDRARIRDELKMSSSSALRVLDALSKRPITSAKDLAKESAVPIPTALSTLSALREKGMVAELTGRTKNMLFAYSAYIEVLNRGTELPVANDPHLRAAGATVSAATRSSSES